MLSPNRWREVGPYLDQALTLPDRDRAALVESVRRRNPQVGALLESLLDEHRVLAQAKFLEEDQISRTEPPGLTGQTVGPYTLARKIGHGGMGSVWLAERTDGRFERRVAVKFLSVALVGRTGEERFKREGRVLGTLVHPHIAELIDAGVSSTGQPYLILEYVQGEHIDRYCDVHGLDIKERIRLFLDVLEAVGHAHNNLIVHRDIKPSNVLVRNDGRVKLVDFGIAKMLQDDVDIGAATVLTIEAGRPMTPEYASPEQLTGGMITTGTDVYASGALLYILLTGQHPAGGGPYSPAGLVKAIVEREPTRPSEAVASMRAKPLFARANAAKRGVTPEKLRRMLSGDLDTIVLKALKKDPPERYLSVGALADDLEHYLRNEPIKARPDTIAYRARKFVRRKRAAVALATLASMTTASGLVGTLVQARTACTVRDFAIREASPNSALNEFHEFFLSDIAPPGKPLTINQLLGRAGYMATQPHSPNDSNCVALMVVIQKGFRELPTDPQFALARIACLQNGSEVFRYANDVQQDLARSQAVLDVPRQSPFDSDVPEMHCWSDLTKSYSAARHDREAIRTFGRTASLLSALGRNNTATAATLFEDWGPELYQIGHFLEAQKNAGAFNSYNSRSPD
jgi:serine/threonine-protein kinase